MPNNEDILESELVYDATLSDDEEEDPEEDEEQESDENVSSYKKEMDAGSSVVAEFRHGFSLKIVIEYLRMTNWQGTFIFRKDKIIYQQMNPKKTVLNSLVINTHELTQYKLQSTTGEVIMKVNLADLRQRTRSILKKDKVVISKVPYDTNMYLAIYSQNTSSMGEHPNHHIIPTLPPEYSKYKRPTYERGKKRPNCTVDQGDFAKLCSSFTAVKCSYVIVHGFENGVLFRGMSPTHEEYNVKEFGNCTEALATVTKPDPLVVPSGQAFIGQAFTEPVIKIRRPKQKTAKLVMAEPGELESIKISIDIIKGLAKLNNLSTSGTIKMYMEPKKPLCLACNIGTYGELSVYIRALKE